MNDEVETTTWELSPEERARLQVDMRAYWTEEEDHRHYLCMP
jgi:hypothetical protein